MEQHVLGTVSGQSSLGTVLGQCSLGTVLDQSSLGTKQSWDSGLGTLLLGQWSWDSGLGTSVWGHWSWDIRLGTLTRSTGTTLNSLETVERKSWNSIKQGGTKRVLSQGEVTNCKIKILYPNLTYRIFKSFGKVVFNKLSIPFIKFCQKRF